jgi:hypothetical protein
MRAVPSPRLLVAVLMLAAFTAVLAGCGKSAPSQSSGGELSGQIPPLSTQGAIGVATKNTTRLGGTEPVSDAAAVARAVYPGLTIATRPQAVVLVDEHDWAASLAASALASAPLNAPLLYSEGARIPDTSLQALRAMGPLGAATLGGAQVIGIGASPAIPGGFRTRTVSAAGGPSSVAAAIAQLLTLARGGAPHQVIVLATNAPPALQMPAAGLSAESGAPILFVSGGAVPTATAAALRSLRRPAIYVIDPAAVGPGALAALARFGHVTPILDGPLPAEAEHPTPVENANAVARFTDGKFGWGVKEPGHGLVFANAGRPLDAPAAAMLSASGDYGPLLLLESPDALPSALVAYLSDIQPAYGSAPQYEPVHGAYNHGWLIGDEGAISLHAQAEIDSLLEISPRHASPEEEPSTSPTESPLSTPAG